MTIYMYYKSFYNISLVTEYRRFNGALEHLSKQLKFDTFWRSFVIICIHAGTSHGNVYKGDMLYYHLMQ